jgi:hypothetical protein
MDGGVILAIIALAVVVCIILIGVIVHKRKRKKREALTLLGIWISQAKIAGYDYLKMKTDLKIKGWNRKLIEKALKDNGVEKPVI